jgi:hypothetical protein
MLSAWRSFSFFYFIYFVNALHSVQLVNNCNVEPILVDHNGNTLANTSDPIYTNDTVQAFAYVNSIECGSLGENCIKVDLDLGLGSNDSSVAFINLSPGHALFTPIGFAFGDDCGAPTFCLTKQCKDAARGPNGPGYVSCNAPSVNITVTFCPPGSDQQSLGSTLPTSSKHSSLPPSLIAGIVLVTLIFLAFIALLVWFIRRRRRQRTPPSSSFIIEKMAIDRHRAGTNANDPELDGIVDRLATRFGWAVSEHGASLEKAPVYTLSGEPPRYNPA